FDTAHPNFTDTGAATTVANYQAGSGNPTWYLLDTNSIFRGFVYQKRRPFQVIPKFSMTDPSVFWDNEFVWGVDGRSNAGYGLWHYTYRSDAALTQANLVAARTSMASLHRQDGAPMGIGAGAPLLLVVPTALLPVAKGFAEDQYDPTVTTNLTPNNMRGLVRAVESAWLN
ncbi:MAG: Mu-like prophage major head subunit gpT family protein, partial [Trebonia sp.]